MVKKFFTDESINTLVTESKKYADSAATKVKNDLLNGAGAAYDTLKELGDLIDDNQDAISALQTVASGKADKSDLTSHTGDTTAHITSTERTNWNAAKTHADSAHAPSNAQVNVIESIKVNNTAQTISSKSVNITVPTKASDISAAPSSHVGDSTHITSTERTNWNAAKTHADSAHAPSNAQANVIESVKVNGTAQTISSKSVNISVPTKASDISAAPSSHVGDSSHITSDERTNWNAAYSHSQASHAPSDAEKNQNAFSNVKVGSTTVAADSATDTLTLVAGNNVTITPDASNDSINISATDTNTTYTIATGDSNGQIKVTPSSGSAYNVSVKGLGSAAYTASTAYDAAGKADSALSSAKSYTDTAISNLINSAPTTLDTLGEIATAMQENADVVDALEEAIGNKVDKVSGKGLSTNDYTTAEKNKLAGLATVATSGSYNDLTNKPTIPAAYTHPTSHPASMITGLATVATSGSYNDLTNKPTIPAAYTHPTYTAKTGVPTANATPGFGGTFTVTQPVSDGTGHITGMNSRTITIPSTLAGSSAGLVKSGGDVTISSGVITVNDDSHNHVISNVDGLQTVLDAKADTGHTHSFNDLQDKPFYEKDPVETVIIPQTTFTGSSKVISSDLSSFTIGETYSVVWDGTTYNNLVCHEVSGLAAIGASDFNFTDYSFLIGIDNGNCNIMASTNASHTFKVTAMIGEVVPLNRKYIAEYLDEIPVYAGRKVSGVTGAEIFNHYSSNTASASYSHAEGTGTTASGTASHAEGYETVAEGGYSHAQGYKTQATGNRSHAEGQGSIASGDESHAEGLDTIAAGQYQHVQGKYNVEDTTGTYAHIVGNGSYNNRKNAHTLDWSGNAWFKGDVYVGGTGQDDGDKLIKQSDITSLGVMDLTSVQTAWAEKTFANIKINGGNVNGRLIVGANGQSGIGLYNETADKLIFGYNTGASKGTVVGNDVTETLLRSSGATDLKHRVGSTNYTILDTGNYSDLGIMDLTSDQTSTGFKTFTNGIKIGNATMTYDSENKRIVISVQ